MLQVACRTALRCAPIQLSENATPEPATNLSVVSVVVGFVANDCTDSRQRNELTRIGNVAGLVNALFVKELSTPFKCAHEGVSPFQILVQCQSKHVGALAGNGWRTGRA